MVRDTLQLKDTLVTDSIITSTTWKLQEARWVRGNVADYYLRGTTNNVGQDNERMTFSANGTGKLVDGNQWPADFTWTRTQNADRSVSIKITIAYPLPTGNIPVYWNNVAYKNGALVFEEFYDNVGMNLKQHSRMVRIPLAKDYINVHL